MSRRRTIDDWRREVYRSRTLKDHAKVVLLYLADHMRQDLRVSVPRETIAKQVGKSERGVTRSITEAKAAGLLDTIVAGRKHVTAVYAATFPDVLSGTQAVSLREREETADDALSGTFFSPLRDVTGVPLRTPNQALSGTHAVPPIQERTCSQSGTDRNGGSKEKVGREVASTVTACPWHEAGNGTPEDCVCTSNRRESA